ncbi:ArnT family glycosyltransferase [Candidatus Margulisiibacteriota bacterium]
MRLHRSTIIILVLILALQVLLRLPFLHVPLERDEGAYGYMAQRVLAGEMPYRDAFDHKPPLVYYTYAAFVKLFGNSIEAIRYPTLVYSLLSTIALFYLGALLWGSGIGLLAALFYAVFSGGVLIQGFTSNTETFMVLPLILALIFFIKGQEEKEEGLWYFYAGLFSGVALMFKQVAVFNFLILFLLLFSRESNRFNEVRLRFDLGRAGRLLLGSLLVPACFLLYFTLRGALPDLIHDVLLVNFKYLRSLEVPIPNRLVFGLIVTVFRANVENSLVWLFGLLGVAYVLIKERSRENLAVVLWALASLLGAMGSGLFFGHYYIQLMPALCLLSALAVGRVARETGLLLKVALVAVSIFLIWKIVPYQYPFYLQYSPDQISEHQQGKNSYVLDRRLADDFKRFLKPQETLLVWPANPQLYFYLNKKAPTRYYNYLQWMEDEAVRAEVVGSILANKPDYIVWTLYGFPYPELVELIKKEYRLFMMIDKWKVFKRIK